MKTIVITGASSGIGASAARQLAAMGWHAAVVGRNPERTAAVAKEVGGEAFVADFDRLEEVRGLAASLAARYEHIDVLANNAGGLVSKRGLSTDGHERTIQHNHYAAFLLTNLLMPTILASGTRVIGTASVANRFGSLRLDDLDWGKRAWFGGFPAYGTSKIATIVFTRSLAERGVDAYSFHPGYVATGFGKDSAGVRFGNRITGGRLMIPASEGAAPLVHLATSETVDAVNGTYFDRLKPYGSVHRSASIPGVGAGLWQRSAAAVGLD